MLTKRNSRWLLFISIVSVIILFLILRIYFSPADIKIEEIKEKNIYNPPRLYGINLDSFNIEQGQIKKNEFFGSLLLNLNIPATQINSIIEKIKPVFDIRKIRKGNSYTCFFLPDSTHNLKYIVYEHSSTEYLFVELNDTIHVSLKQKPTHSVIKNARGKINSSLWNSMADEKLPPSLAIELSEIYAWTIDFFGLQPKDSFCVVYEEIYTDSMLVNIGKIYVAAFYHSGKIYYAIPFVQDDRESYFDENGASLRREFLKAPLRFSHISSRFSEARLHPVLKIVRPHHGVDYAAPYGTPVLSIGDGKIMEMSYDMGSGNMIRIRHNAIYSTTYMHLQKYATGLKTGSTVMQGEVIAYVGSTGMATGPHLDFRIYKNGSPINPLKVDAPHVEPIKTENRSQFDSLKNASLRKLTLIGDN
jgi:murein DD-endopeptidase MepM/ murein hydrolase activator NlpD